MAGVLSYVPGVSTLLGLSRSSSAVNIPSIEVHRIEADPDRRARCLKHLLKANHVNHSIIYRDQKTGRFNANEVSHSLCSAFVLGATVAQLNDIYDAQTKHLASWEPSPAELVDDDWKEYLGDEKYARAFVDFFEDKLAMEYAYDWRKVVMRYLFSAEQPLFSGLFGEFGQAVISLAHAFEMDNKELAMEALGLAAVQYNALPRYMDFPKYTRPSPLAKGSPRDLLLKMTEDSRFANLKGSTETSAERETLLLEYWNAWDIEDPTLQFMEMQLAAAETLLTANRPRPDTFDPLLARLLTTSRAVRVLLPFFAAEYHVQLMRQWWLFAVATLIDHGGLRQSASGVPSGRTEDDWNLIRTRVLTEPLSNDGQCVLVVAALHEASETWGDERRPEFRKAAAGFVHDFGQWTP